MTITHTGRAVALVTRFHGDGFAGKSVTLRSTGTKVRQYGLSRYGLSGRVRSLIVSALKP